MGSFSEKIAVWSLDAKGAIREVFVEATILTVNFMQQIGPSTAYPGGLGGANPVDTGWHTSSIQVSLTSMPKIIEGSTPPPSLMPGSGLHMKKWDKNKTFSDIAAANIGQTIYIGYTAEYSGHLEYRGGPSSAFVRLAAQKWSVFVEQAKSNIRSHRGM